MSNSILLTPGPVQLHPDVLKTLSLPMIHHRTPEFDHILKKTLQDIKTVFETQQPCFLLSSTGTGGLETLLVNTLNPKDKVLALITGKFGERWADMAEVYGAEVIRVSSEWGTAISSKQVETELAKHPDIKIVLCQACETSTAVANPIKEIADLVKKTSALFLVDGITALGAYPLPMDEWSIDGLVGGSQKAFMLPTGMSFVSFSQKAWEKIKTSKTPKFYFDIQKEQAANSKGETYFSSNVSLIRALNTVLDIINKKGLSSLHKEIARRADYTRAMAPVLNLHLYSKSPSNSVTALTLPSTIDGVKFREHLEQKYSLTVMGGQDQLKGKIIRLGHMGYITEDDLHQTTLKIANGLNDFGFHLEIQKVNNQSSEWLKANPL